MRTNKKTGWCTECGGEVLPGEGHLWWQPGPDDGGDVVGRTPAGYRVTHVDKSVCEVNREQIAAAQMARQEAAQRAAQAKEAAEKSALEAQQREIDLLLSEIPDVVIAGYDWDRTVIDWPGERFSFVALDVPTNPALAGLSLGSVSWTRHRAVDGSMAYVEHFGNAKVLHAKRSVVERAWSGYPNRSHYTHTDWIDAEFSATALEDWLKKHGPEARSIVDARAKKERGEYVSSWDLRPTAGWEVRAYKAGRIDLLVREGVIPA